MSGRPYSKLGNVMDEIARERNVRGPHRIANYVKAQFPEAPGGVSVSNWMYGETNATRENIQRFARAFELTEEEKVGLALAYTFDEEPPRRT